MSRFVILRHDMPAGSDRPSHWDLMFEMSEALATWSLRRLPEAGQIVPADRLPDHRLIYLDYEGPVSGERGTVRRWDGGEYERIAEDQNAWCARVRGRRLRGILRLTPAPLPTGQRDLSIQRWMCEFDAAGDEAAC